MDDVFDGYGVSIELEKPQDFLRVKETLTRIGYPSKLTKTLFQSCHIFHKRGRYSIMHFSEMYHFDGISVNPDENDIIRRNSIARLLEQWKLIRIKTEIMTPFVMTDIVVVPHKEKGNWTLVEQYNVGKVR